MLLKTTKIEQDLGEIKDMLKQLCYTLGVGKLPPAKIIELRKKAKEEARKYADKKNNRE